MKYWVSFCLFFLLLSLSTGAQSIEDAHKLYSEGKYAEAMPLYEAIVKSTAKKTVAMKPEAWQSLGNVYYQLYEFDKSTSAYSKYADLLTKEKKTAEVAAVTALIERSERAARMLSRCESIQLIDSVIVDKNRFLSAYMLSSESGHLENRDGRVIYENPLRDKRYFAFDKTGSGSRLYSEVKLQNEWTDRMQLNIPSDSLAKDDFPFVLPDGLTIYYASTGKSSIGGYDLYITRYNMNHNTWLAPSQMGMPFNSIANDYMLAIDEINRIGYFATDRFQPEGKVVVYTFIPNEEIVTLETNNREELISRARITSIRNTWKPNVNYKAYLDNARRAIQNELSQPVRDFTFVINDQTVYYTLGDFKKDAAKQAFLKTQEVKKSIEKRETELETLRSEFAQANTGRKQNMRANILSKEEQLQDLYRQWEQFERNARNFEQIR